MTGPSKNYTSINSDEITIGSESRTSFPADGDENVKYASNFSGADGGAQIQSAIDAADATAGPNVVIVSGPGPDSPASAPESDVWAYSTPPLLPDNTTLILRNSYLYLKDGSDENLLRNADAKSGDATRNSDIAVHGFGRAVLDGNAANQTRVDATAFSDNIGLRFYKVDGLKITGVTVRDTNAWGVKAEDVTDLTVRDYNPDQTDDTANQDGIDLMGPVDGATIQNVYGTSGDDFVAIFAGADWDCVEGTGGNVTNVSIETVKATVLGNHRPVRIAAQSGGEVHQISVEDITAENTDIQEVVEFGPKTFNAGTAPTLGDISDIAIRDIKTQALVDEIVQFETPVLNCRVTGITSEQGSQNGQVIHVTNSVTIRNISISSVNIVADTGGGGDFFKVDSGSTVSRPDISDVRYRSTDNTTGYLIANAGTISDLQLSDFFVTEAAGVISDAGTLDGTIGQGDWNAISAFTNTAPVPLRSTQGLPAIDVRDLSNEQGSEAYHDGSGTNTEGPAFNDGAGWESLVDGTTIS